MFTLIALTANWISGKDSAVLLILTALTPLFAHAVVAAEPADKSWPLEETRPPIRETAPPVLAAPLSIAGPRVLIVGDSWAQYMWDDGSYEDIFDKWGHNDKLPLSRSLGSDPGPGYTGAEYAVSQSEASQWVDTANYPWIANMVAELQVNPTIDVVVLSIGGNDVLAGRPDGGWYKDMDLDAAGSEAAFFSRLHTDTFTIIDAAKAVRPDIDVLISSYDYPNFNVGFWCFVYACPKRDDLSRDPNNDLITDAELNDMMVTVETQRIGWANSDPRILFDHSVGLLHHYFGDSVTGPGLLPHPGQTPPDYLPFPGGNPLKPTLRSLFRRPGGIDADPIHLNHTGYQYKITNQTETLFFPRFRGPVSETFVSQGGTSDGWTDGTTTGTGGISLGDNGASPYYGLLSFDTSSIPDGSLITEASLYMIREASTGSNPFTSGDLGSAVIDVVSGSFGAPGVETSDATAPADATDAGYTVGTASDIGYAIRIDITGGGLDAIYDQGTTQFRVHFPAPGTGSIVDQVTFYDGDAGLPASTGLRTLADYMGSAKPFLDISYYAPGDDTDSDGLSDIFEYGFFGDLDEVSGGDPEGDNFTNLEEQNAGTDPTEDSFIDVPIAHTDYDSIQALLSNDIATGCGNGRFCPNQVTSRESAVLWLLKAANGGSYTPPTAGVQHFDDVDIGSTVVFGDGDFAADWIEDLFLPFEISEGCDAGPDNFCPTQALTREQLAILILKARYGGSYTPPAATGTVFNDVAQSDFAAAWMEDLFNQGFTQGCDGDNYCPKSVVTAAEFARVLALAFGL